MKLSFNQLVEQAKKDLDITSDNLVEASANTGIHLLFYAEQRKLYVGERNRISQQLTKVKRLLWQYYSGKANAKVLETLNRKKPFQIQFSTKGDIDNFILSDPEYQVVESELNEIESVIKFLDEVIGAIRFRTQVVRNILQEKQLLGG